MIKCSLWLCASISILGLAGCSKNDTSVSISASDIAADVSSAATAIDSYTPTQTLVSNDNKINIVVNGQYQNQLNSPDEWIETSEISSLTLLQHDDVSDITLAVNNLGPAKLASADYFKNLQQQLKNNPQLTNQKIGVATDNRMNYRFTHTLDNIPLRENCVALMGANNLYSVCASSGTADDTALASALKNISIQS